MICDNKEIPKNCTIYYLSYIKNFLQKAGVRLAAEPTCTFPVRLPSRFGWALTRTPTWLWHFGGTSTWTGVCHDKMSVLIDAYVNPGRGSNGDKWVSASSVHITCGRRSCESYRHFRVYGTPTSGAGDVRIRLLRWGAFRVHLFV